MGGLNSLEPRLLVAVEATGYGGSHNQADFAGQSGLTAALTEAAAAAGLRRDLWLRQLTGNGELAVLPRDESASIVVDDYMWQLDATLARRNSAAPQRARIRLRVAIHFGGAMSADHGLAGQGVVAVSRLVDSQPVRNALAAAPGANVAVIVSSRVFNDVVVRQGELSFAHAEFTKALLQVKEFQDEAWVAVIRAVVGPESARPAGEPSDSQKTGPPAASHGLTQHFHGDVYAPQAVFGISNITRRDH